ncbi:hypothetical protein [Streptomyces sp. C10-9-1]|uniref:hypothetical protein n=1 Tax=Streptomyces sp. C10-9-1 TaxID=1859285 RepID=UPI003F4A5586
MDRDSLEEVLTPITAAVGDPTDFDVRVALVAVGARPTEDDWHPASWTTQDGIPHSVLLVGPGGTVDPGPGTYRTWTEITAAPEKPVLLGGRLHIT